MTPAARADAESRPPAVKPLGAAISDAAKTVADTRGTPMSLMLSYRRIWVIGDRPSPLLPAGPMREESLVLAHDFTRVVVRGYRGIWLTFWIRRE